MFASWRTTTRFPYKGKTIARRATTNKERRKKPCSKASRKLSIMMEFGYEKNHENAHTASHITQVKYSLPEKILCLLEIKYSMNPYGDR